jgi:phage tail-like protein
MAPPGARHDPLSGFNILVEIEGVPSGAFTECTGLVSEVEVVTYRQGGDFRTRKLPGLVKYPPLVLKRGFVMDRSLWDWHRTVLDGKVQRRSGSIILLSAERKPVARWNFVEGWPAKWQGPELNAQSSAVAIETLEIVHEGLEWVD